MYTIHEHHEYHERLDDLYEVGEEGRGMNWTRAEPPGAKELYPRRVLGKCGFWRKKKKKKKERNKHHLSP